MTGSRPYSTASGPLGKLLALVAGVVVIDGEVKVIVVDDAESALSTRVVEIRDNRP